MTCYITPIQKIYDNKVYVIEGITTHNHKRYADAYRRYQGRLIKVECEETREALGMLI